MKLWVSLSIFLIFASAEAKNFDCNTFLTIQNSSSTENITEKFISFVSHLREEQQLSIEFIELLANGELTNPFDTIETKSAQSTYKPIFQAYLEADLEKEKIQKWAKEYLIRHGIKQEQRKQVEAETASPWHKMRFHKLKGGTVALKHPIFIEPEIANINYDFEMMDTVVTRSMWEKVMHTKPADFNPNTFVMEEEGDLPMTNITWWSAAEFANRFSELQGLPPVYDFSGIEFVGSPELGTYKPVLDTIFEAYVELWKRDSFNKPESMLGYRLPTAIEQEFVRAPFKTLLKEDVFLNPYAWLCWNSNDKIHGVATRDAFVFQDIGLYDLYGNVYEWSDTKVGKEIIRDKNYQGPLDVTGVPPPWRRIYGYSYQHSTVTIREYGEKACTERSSIVGLRLVRTLPK